MSTLFPGIATMLRITALVCWVGVMSEVDAGLTTDEEPLPQITSVQTATSDITFKGLYTRS